MSAVWALAWGFAKKIYQLFETAFIFFGYSWILYLYWHTFWPAYSFYNAMHDAVLGFVFLLIWDYRHGNRTRYYSEMAKSTNEDDYG